MRRASGRNSARAFARTALSTSSPDRPGAPSGERDAVLVTRPEPGATQTAAQIAALGWRPIVSPLLVIRPTDAGTPDPERLQAIVVTSRNGVAALSGCYRPLPLFTVGDATAAAASGVGFRAVTSASGDATDLAAMIARMCDPASGPLLLATGAGQGGPLAATLRAAGFSVLRRVVYAAQPVTAAPAEMTQALAGGLLRSVVFFSAGTADHFGILLADLGQVSDIQAVDAVAISRRCANALKRLPWRDVRVAQRPTQDGVLAQLR